MTVEQQISDLKRTINQLEQYGKVSFDVIIDLYKILDMTDPERTYDPKNLKNVNNEEHSRVVDFLKNLAKYWRFSMQKHN